jgi:hypothetical protein
MEHLTVLDKKCNTVYQESIDRFVPDSLDFVAILEQVLHASSPDTGGSELEKP